MAKYAREPIGAIPFTQFDPALRTVGKEVLICVEREVLFVQIGFQMEHMTKSDETGIVGPSREGRITREDASEEVASDETFFGSCCHFLRIIHGWERASVLFQRDRWHIPNQEARKGNPCNSRRTAMHPSYVGRESHHRNNRLDANEQRMMCRASYGRQGSKISSQSFEASKVEGANW